MSARDDEIRRVVAELDAHVAKVEANLAVLKALLADDEVPGEESSAVHPPGLWFARGRDLGDPSLGDDQVGDRVSD